MSYDVVALVAGRPDERAVIDALQDLDQDLRLHQHGDTAVLQIRDEAGRLLATLEPGRPIECWDDVARLLDADIVAGLPDPCWWVETRARPDEQGREVAHRFADRLALRLGGAVWTSGQADFGLWQGDEVRDDGKDEEEDGSGHPAIERTAARAVLIAQDRPVVPFSSWLSDAVATRARDKVLQVLTPHASRLTYGARTFVAGPLGRWVVRGEDGGHYDGLTGLPLHWDDEDGFRADKEPVGVDWAAREPDAEPVPGFRADFAETAGTQLVVDVSVRHGDTSEPRLGRAAEVVAEHLAGAPPTVWGPHEPALMAWGTGRLAEFVRERAPRPSVLYLSGPLGQGHPFSGQIRATWRGTRVQERISVAVGFEDEAAAPFDALPALVEELAAEGLLDGLRIGRLPGRTDTTYVPLWAGPAVPVGIAIGPDRLRRIGAGLAQAGPMKGTLLGEDEHQAAWYPVLADAAAPLRALDLIGRQSAHLSAAERG
ncbi:hypothetical protein DFP74_6093 [Nocardiopsis sp. Huas11]|uniref:DUF6177 family protein n=1 Tax=Nocardiopsis sp. Huas11 TaxID=2183912 RepID=UPI000EABE89E|nr:DUF6177 family protein [Nocardiopsis sp. Huas11]RKS10330.1 hypothetical protein DFP74_6093 [Nocardiopsis sp. Huas11]